MAKLMFLIFISLLSIISQNAAEETRRLARQRHRILHHRYPQTFRYKPGAEEDEPRRRGGHRTSGRRTYQTFELPNEMRQPWAPQRKMPYNHRPVDIYGSPPANWPNRPPLGRQPPGAHEIYGPPVEMPDTPDDEVRDRGFRNDYEYEQYPEDEFQGLQQPKGQQQKAAMQKSEQYIGEEMQQKQPKEDKIENFEIPLELLVIPQQN